MHKTIEDLVAEERGFRNRLSELDNEYAGRSMTAEAKSEWEQAKEDLASTITLREELRGSPRIARR